jgi:hypothetical protein
VCFPAIFQYNFQERWQIPRKRDWGQQRVAQKGFDVCKGGGENPLEEKKEWVS